MPPVEDRSPAVSMPATSEPPSAIDVRTIEPLLMAQAARGACSWPWLIQFLQSLTRAVRASARFFPPHREEGALHVQVKELPAALGAILDRQDHELADAVRRDRKTIYRRTELNGEHVAQLGTPLSGGGGEPRGALMLWIRQPPDQALEPFLVALQLVAGFGQAAASREQAVGGPHLAASLTALAARLADARDAADASQAFADEAVRLTGCDAAALALGRSGRWRAVAVSGCAQFDRTGAMAGAVAAALRELELGSAPAAFHAVEPGTPAQFELARQWNCRALRAWFLTGTRPNPPATILLGFRQTDLPGADLDRTLEAAAPAWASLAAVSLRLGLGGAAREWLGRLARPLGSNRWKIALGVAALLTAVLLWPMAYTIRAASRVEAADRRTVASPSDGTLKSNHVELGQNVEAGQALGEMDDAEVLIRLSEVRANRERALARYAAILSHDGGDAATAQLARLDAEVAEIEIKLLEHRLQSLALTAPVSGTVLREPSRVTGSRIPLGSPLYEIAPAGAIRLEVDIPDNRIAYVHEGQELTVFIESYPGRTWRARISKVHPQSEVREGANFFVVEAIPLVPAPEWKPGMKGRAIVESEPRAVGWILFHPVWEFVEWMLF